MNVVNYLGYKFGFECKDISMDEILCWHPYPESLIDIGECAAE
jgi:hypothetical protein